MHVRASRSLSGEQVAQLEKLVFAGGAPGRDQLDMLDLIDTYLLRRDPRWTDLMIRAAFAVAPVEGGRPSAAVFAEAA